jgi:hypothetical protein
MHLVPTNVTEGVGIRVNATENPYYYVLDPVRQDIEMYSQDQQFTDDSSSATGHHNPPGPHLPMSYGGLNLPAQQSEHGNNVPGGWHNPLEWQLAILLHDNHYDWDVSDPSTQSFAVADTSTSHREDAYQSTHNNEGIAPTLTIQPGHALGGQLGGSYGESGPRVVSSHNVPQCNESVADVPAKLHQLIPADEDRENTSSAAVGESDIWSSCFGLTESTVGPATMVPCHLSGKGSHYVDGLEPLLGMCAAQVAETPLFTQTPTIVKDALGYANPIAAYRRLMDEGGPKVPTEEMDRLFFPSDQKHEKDENGHYVCRIMGKITVKGPIEWRVSSPCGTKLKTMDNYRRHILQTHMGLGRTAPKQTLTDSIGE